MEPTRRSRRVRVSVVAVVAAVLVYAWFASAFRPFTLPEEVMVTIPLVVAVFALLRSRPAAAEDGDDVRRGVWVWRALLAAFLVWELISFVSSPRSDHPTISSIGDWIMSTHAGRFAAFVAWLAAGYGMFRP
jgi:hypothetical protein